MRTVRWLALIVAAVIGCTGPACAQAPAGDAASGRPITLVVPIAAGGGMDTIGRAVAERLQERLKQPVVVENRVGAGGVVGVDYVAKAAPDGRTLLLMDISAVLHKWLHKSVPFDVIADFTPVAQVATTPLLLFANPSLAAADVRELIAYAKANPGKLSVGTPGVGSPHHLAAAMLNSAAKIDITHVPYRGTAPALNDLVGGQIPLIWATPNVVVQFVEAGKVKPLAVASAQRIALLPQVPTVSENALAGFDVGVWFGIAAPAKTPRDVVERLGREIGEITRLPDLHKRLSPLGYELNYAGSERFRDLIAADHKRYGTVIREAGIAPN
ncbi:MAG TPA: tripartite tricarboxylate transporter substrate binding protein [Xanthobacteraceae bacterium]|nr:tripartite tricarboxylate transporter substrate binding protein [Xanthobacteraceae bacterium]